MAIFYLIKKYVGVIIDRVTTIIGTRNTNNGLWSVYLSPNGTPLPATDLSYMHMANSAYAQKTKTEILDLLHRTTFSPTFSSWKKSINNNFFLTWTGLTSYAIRKFLFGSINTGKRPYENSPKKFEIHQTLLVHKTCIHYYDDADIYPC